MHHGRCWPLLALAGGALALPQGPGLGLEQQMRASGHDNTPTPTARSTEKTGGDPRSTDRSSNMPKATPTRKPFSKMTEIPSGSSSIPVGPWTLPADGLATACSDAWVPFQTDFWVKTSQQSFIGSDWFQGENTNWTIRTDTPGVVLGVPYVPAAMDSETGVSKMQFDIINRTRKNVLDISIGPIGQNMMQMQIYNDNGTGIPEDAWKLQNGQHPSDRDDLDGLGLEDVVAHLNITGYGICEFPVDADTTCRVGNINLTAYNWEGYKTDEFFDKWLKSKNGDYGSLGMMETFKADYGINTDVCSVQKPCNSLQKCSNQGEPESEEAIPAYLVYIAMVNLSNFLNTIYSNVLSSSIFQTNEIATMVQEFYKDPNADYKPESKAPEPLSLAGALIGMSAFMLMGVPGAGGLAAASAAGIVGGSLGIAGMFQHAPDKRPMSELNFARGADLSDSLATVVSNLQYQLEQWHISTISKGENVQKMFEGGGFIDRTTIQFDTEHTSKAAGWLNQYISIKLINHAWWAQNAYISFMPYGQVYELQGLVPSDKQQNFDEGQCASNFRDKYKDQVVICNTSEIFQGSEYPNGGMARLTWYDPSKYGPGICSASGGGSQGTHQSLDLHGAIQGAKSTVSFAGADNNYTFNAEDVVYSSLKGWMNHGFAYDYVSEQTNRLTGGPDDNAALEVMAGFGQGSPSDAGMYALPVAVVKNLDFWPDFSTIAGYWPVVDGQKDKNGLALKDDKVVPPQLQTFFKQDDMQLEVKKRKC